MIVYSSKKSTADFEPLQHVMIQLEFIYFDLDSIAYTCMFGPLQQIIGTVATDTY